MANTLRSAYARMAAAVVCCLAAFNSVSCTKTCAATAQGRAAATRAPHPAPVARQFDMRASRAGLDPDTGGGSAIILPQGPNKAANAGMDPDLPAGKSKPAPGSAGADPDTGGGGPASRNTDC